MKFGLLITVLLLISSCSSTVSSESKGSPYDSYTSYIKSLNNQNYKASLNLLSKGNNLRFNQQKENEEFDVFFPFFSSINTVVINEINHYQEIYSEKSCLTVVGFDSENEPASVNFELFNEGGVWRFSFVEMIYHESSVEFSKSVMCPKKQ